MVFQYWDLKSRVPGFFFQPSFSFHEYNQIKLAQEWNVYASMCINVCTYMCINMYAYMYLNVYAYMCEVNIEMNFQQNKKTKKVPKHIASFNEDWRHCFTNQNRNLAEVLLIKGRQFYARCPGREYLFVIDLIL